MNMMNCPACKTPGVMKIARRGKLPRMVCCNPNCLFIDWGQNDSFECKHCGEPVPVLDRAQYCSFKCSYDDEDSGEAK